MNPNLLLNSELAFNELTTLEAQLIDEIKALFKRQDDHLNSIDQLYVQRPDMIKIDEQTKKLSNLIDSSSKLANEVCSKFSRIDMGIRRLQDCISKISDIHDLRSCQTGVTLAMELQHYEEAAMHIKRYLAIDQSQLIKTTAIICGDDGECSKPNEITQLDQSDSYYIMSTTTMNESLKQLDQARSKLLRLCQDLFQKAIAENDLKNVDRFFKIFPMLGEHKDGLVRYSDYMKSKIVTPHIANVLKSNESSQADKLGALYERFAKMIDTHQPLIETYYGPGHMVTVIRILLGECDQLSRRILEEFRDAKKLSHITRAIQRATNPRLPLQNSNTTGSTGSNYTTSNTPLGGSTVPPELDPRNIDSTLNELALIISRSEIYLNFLVQRMEEEVKSRAPNDAQRQQALIEIYKLISIDCEVNYLIQELGGIYVLLERFYLEESTRIAIQTDEIDAQSYPFYVSSMLDDTFFIIKKCAKRAISTKSNEVFCAIINHCVQMLDTTFCQYFDDKLRNQQYYSIAFSGKNLDLTQAYNAIQTSHYLQSSSEREMSKAQFFSSLNDLNRASDYISTLKGLLKNDINKLRSPRLALLLTDNKHCSQVEKSVTCLDELSRLTDKFNSIVNSALYQLFDATLKSRVKNELKSILNENPTIATEIAKNPEELVRIARDLLLNIEKPLQKSLTPMNYSKLVSITRYCLGFYLNTPT